MKKIAWLLTGLMAVSGALLSVPSTLAQAAGQPEAKATETEDDILIFHTGKQMTGKVVSETATSVKFKGSVSGLSFETEYPKSEILLIKRGKAIEKKADGVKPEAGKDGAAKASEPVTGSEPIAGQKRIYWIDLTGEFGEDISQTPIRKAVKDAQDNKADVIILHLDALFSQDGKTPLPNDMANFDEIFRAEPITEVFTQEIKREWKNPPRVVMWVKDAMAGAALLPFVCPEIYFHSQGRIGGLGNLSSMFGSMGDDVVREKQRSLRMGHAEGWANSGGYDYRLIRAMARVEYVLSARFENGLPVLFEGYPKEPGDVLLTDDGMDGNADTLSERVAGTGNDVLTLDERTARMIGVSKGTVDTKDELIAAMGLERDGVMVEGRSKQIMKEWSSGLDNAKRRVRRLMEEYQEIQVAAPGGYTERTAARGHQRRVLENIKSLLKQWGEGISQRWLGENQVPPADVIDTILERIRLEQMSDSRR
jgi:hypothetical protein